MDDMEHGIIIAVMTRRIKALMFRSMQMIIPKMNNSNNLWSMHSVARSQRKRAKRKVLNEEKSAREEVVISYFLCFVCYQLNFNFVVNIIILLIYVISWQYKFEF